MPRQTEIHTGDKDRDRERQRDRETQRQRDPSVPIDKVSQNFWICWMAHHSVPKYGIAQLKEGMPGYLACVKESNA